jgi:hypothetical protein
MNEAPLVYGMQRYNRGTSDEQIALLVEDLLNFRRQVQDSMRRVVSAWILASVINTSIPGLCGVTLTSRSEGAKHNRHLLIHHLPELLMFETLEHPKHIYRYYDAVQWLCNILGIQVACGNQPDLSRAVQVAAETLSLSVNATPLPSGKGVFAPIPVRIGWPNVFESIDACLPTTVHEIAGWQVPERLSLVDRRATTP